MYEPYTTTVVIRFWSSFLERLIFLKFEANMKSSTDNSSSARRSLNASGAESIAAYGSLLPGGTQPFEEEEEQKMPLNRGVTVHLNFINIFGHNSKSLL